MVTACVRGDQFEWDIEVADLDACVGVGNQNDGEGTHVVRLCPNVMMVS
jgi:hypothetical protein